MSLSYLKTRILQSTITFFFWSLNEGKILSEICRTNFSKENLFEKEISIQMKSQHKKMSVNLIKLRREHGEQWFSSTSLTSLYLLDVYGNGLAASMCRKSIAS